MNKNIASERVRLGLTQKQFAERLGISESTVRRLESPKVEPSGELLIRMANLCGCTADYLLGLTDQRKAMV